MEPKYQESEIWKQAFVGGTENGFDRKTSTRLQAAYEVFRENAKVLASRISAELPQLTDHSIKHLDGLWNIASLLVGASKPLNPAESFVLGSSFLLHDLGNSVAAMQNGIEDLKGPAWDDLVYSIYKADLSREPTRQELLKPPANVQEQAIFARLRDVHAEAAIKLACDGFMRHDRPGERLYLLEDQSLRDELGDLIGRIAASHHWGIDKVEEEFSELHWTWSENRNWTIDSLRIAILLRCTDAAHLDASRASTLQMSLVKPKGTSQDHWTFQNYLGPPVLEARTRELVFRSVRPFGYEQREAWWLAFDLLKTVVHSELQNSERILQKNSRPVQTARAVRGSNNPQELSKYIRVENWEPIDISISATDIAGIIERFGGEELYGPDPTAPLRELIANAGDAVRARRAMTNGGLGPNDGKIVVHLFTRDEDDWLEIRDNGIGMSREVLEGPLLDFGKSFWSSNLARQQYPGLISSGFGPTGKFGIGFFSVFMLTDEVEVLTRRFDRGTSQTWSLEVRKERHHQVLRNVSTTPELPFGGSCIRFKLKNQVWSDSGLLSRATVEGSEKERRLSVLKLIIGHLAPALDVKIDAAVSLEDELVDTIPVIEPNDWKVLEFDSLLRRITAGNYHGRDKISPYVCEPVVDGELMGRFRLTTEKASLTAKFITSIGGFRAETHGYRFLEGIVAGVNPQLNRAEAKAYLTSEQLKAEVEKAVDHGFLRHHFSNPELATEILDLGVRPVGLKCFSFASEGGDTDAMDLSELAEMLNDIEIGERIVLIRDQEFSLEQELGGSSDYTIAHELDSMNIEEHVLVTSSDSLFNLAVETIEQAWARSSEKFLTNEYVEVASVHLRSGELQEISDYFDIATRPD